MMSENEKDEWYGLQRPLPDGSKRKRERNEVGENENAEQRKSKEELEKERKRLQKIASQLPPLPPHVTAKFDGACRGNGSANARSSAGMFCLGYECPLTRGELLEVKTNNAAEIEACRMACCTLVEVLPAFAAGGVTRVTIAGDSAQVVATVTNGTIFAYKKRSGLVNSENWAALSDAIRVLLAAASEVGIEIVFTWIPRVHNAEADEMANSILDNRRPDRAIRSVLGSSIDIAEGVARIIATISLNLFQPL
jgi:ribonuclease HI